MTDELNVQQEVQGGGVTLGHLLLAIAFVSPIAAVATETHHAGGGILRYALGISLAFALAVFIVWADWKLGKFLWLRSQQYSGAVQNLLALGVFVLYFLSIVGGDIAGFRLASLIRFVA